MKVILTGDSNEVLFIGFLVQDDFYESLVDYTHAITLSATDGLGLLKSVALSEAEVRRAFTVTYKSIGALPNIIYVLTYDPAFYPQAGDVFEVAGTTYTIVDAIYVVQTIVGDLFNWAIDVTPVTPTYPLTTDTVYLTGEIDLLNKNSILSIIAICLGQTNLPLITNIFHNLYEYRQDNTRSTFETTLLDPRIFITNNNYDDCYSVLTKIMETYKCSIFQANGEWNIINWFEAVPKESWSYANNAIPAFIYDETFTFAGTTIFTNNFNIGNSPAQTRYVHEVLGGAVRGYKFSRKKFDYKQPDQLLRNYNLQYTGSLLRTYISGTTRISEYDATYIQGTNNTPFVERFIRVEYDTILERESDRYLVIRGQGWDDIQTVPFDPIEVNEGDRVNFSCKFRTNVSGTPGTVFFSVNINDGATSENLDSTSATVGSVGQLYWAGGYMACVFPAGEDSIDWHEIDSTTATLPSPQIPRSSLLTIYMPTITDPPQSTGKESHFKEIRLEYIPYINDSTKIIGQVHKQIQPPNIKNNNDVDIYIDDSPRNSIAGTLFLTTKTGVLQDRTTYWRYPPDANGWGLGERTTLDELLWKQKTRSKIESGFVGNYQNSIISLLTMAIFEFNHTKNYTFGLLTINYKRNQFSGTLWEIYDSEDAELDNTYTLEYLYSAT